MNKIKSWLCYGLVNWYTCVLCLMYGSVLVYIGSVSGAGWLSISGATPFSIESWLLVLTRLVVVVFISFKLPTLFYYLIHPYVEEARNGDVWFGFLNFALIVHVTELAIIDILLHGI